MSQEKVDQYKKKKANRKEIMKKEKRQNFIMQVAVALVAVVLLGWVGYSVYNTYDSSQPRETVEVDYTAIETYMNSIGVEE